MTDEYNHWRANLAGEITHYHEGSPESGFYRSKRRGGGYDPVAIFRHDGAMVCLVGGKPRDPAEHWIHCCDKPVTHEAYQAVAERGEDWPDHAPPPIEHGRNMPSDPAEALHVELAGEEAEIERWLATDPIKTEDAASRAADWAKRVADLSAKAERHLKDERKEWDDGLANVRAKWVPLKDWGARLKSRLKDACGPYLKEKAARQAEERAKALREGAPTIPKAVNSNAGPTGRKVKLTTIRRAEIVDFDTCLEALKDNPEIRELVQRLADRAARAGAALPGVAIREDQRAA